MVGLDNPLHIAMLLIVVLLVFGAKRLPEMGKSLGEGLRGFKESVSGQSPPSVDQSPTMLARQAADVHPPVASTTNGPATADTASTTDRAPAQPVA
jgi:sec-independent protein translocase protein TatA